MKNLKWGIISLEITALGDDLGSNPNWPRLKSLLSQQAGQGWKVWRGWAKLGGPYYLPWPVAFPNAQTGLSLRVPPAFVGLESLFKEGSGTILARPGNSVFGK